MTLSDRKCRLASENEEMKLFQRYSKSGCEYECALLKSSQTCGCRPWNLPDVLNNRTKICDLLGNFCFHNTLNSPMTYQNCNCYSDCQTTRWTFFRHSQLKKLVALGNLFSRDPELEYLKGPHLQST